MVIFTEEILNGKHHFLSSFGFDRFGKNRISEIKCELFNASYALPVTARMPAPPVDILLLPS